MKKLLTTQINADTKPKRLAAHLVLIGGILMFAGVFGLSEYYSPVLFAVGIMGSVLFIVGLIGLLVLTLVGVWRRK